MKRLGMVIPVVFLAVTLTGCDPARNTLHRPDDPVVLGGSALPHLQGRAPGRLVGFRYTEAGGWQQVPVQVDERAAVDFGAAPGSPQTPGVTGTVYGTSPTGVRILQYSDPGTFTGADPNALFDLDDELVFMARDAGGLAPAGAPAGVIASSGVQVTLTDPLASDDAGWLYLFEANGTLVPSAGRSYVRYDFRLLSGDYRGTYKRGDGPNPESSSVTTARYTHGFSDRWRDDRLTVKAGTSTEVDVLDRHKNLFAPDECARSEDTFDDAEGAFVVNKTGPVRAIRSYIGANSGPLTQRTHLFYEGRHDIVSDLRVHAIPSVMDFFDYSSAASGMRYANDRNTQGVVVNGQPDTIATGRLRWELVAGAQGSLVHVNQLSTNVAALNEAGAVTSYYLDDTTPPVPQCTGDAVAYGSSGTWVTRGIPDTDPRSGTTNVFRSRRSLTYLAPGATVGAAEQIWRQASSPLVARAATRTG